MKKLILFLAFFIGFVLVGCAKANLVIDKSEINLTISTTQQGKEKINATLENVNKDVKINFESKNKDVAEVDDNGIVTAKNVGSTEIVITVEGYKDLKATVKVNVTVDTNNQFTFNLPDKLIAGSETQLEVTDIADNGSGVIWSSLTTDIATITPDGKAFGKKKGLARFQVVSNSNGNSKIVEVEVDTPPVTDVAIKPNITSTKVKTTENLVLTAEVSPQYAYNEVYWVSSDDSIADIDELGNVTIYTYGTVTFTAVSAENEQITDSITVEFYWDVMDLIDYIMVKDILIKQNTRVTGYEKEYYITLLGSVSNYYFGTYKEYEMIIPSDKVNRPGLKQPSTEFITVHDTGSASASANAQMHARYVNNCGGCSSTSVGTSWHFSIGNDGVYKQLPLDETAYHAGDGSLTFGLLDTGIKVTSKKKPTIAIDSQGYYTLNGERTNIEAPRGSNNQILTTAHINDYGITLEIGENGNWWMGKTHYDSTYNKIGNDGGNKNSIGIETMINEGSDLYLTWHYTAKKVSELLLTLNLGLDRVKFHHFFSGKNCPQTMRQNGLIDNFLKMVEAEYLVRKFLSDYELTLISSHTDIIDNTGRLLKLPNETTHVIVMVSVTNNSGFNETRTYRYVVKPLQNS